MTLNASGPISLGGPVIGQSIQYEIFGTTAPALITLNDPKVRALAQVPTGAIAMPQNFYGKTYTQFFTITTNQINFNLLTYLTANGWDPLARAEVTIAPGVYIYSNSTGTPAMTIAGTYSKGVKITNNGFIIGMGGQGGPTSGAGFSAGPALNTSVPVTVNNTNGTIAGGGGGGGGGGSSSVTCGCSGITTTYGGGGGGGGRTGLTNSLGGVGSSGGGNGGVGTVTSAGGGGAGNNPPYGIVGATGGTWGSAGGNGGLSIFCGPGGVGGAGGAAIIGNTNITWEGFGLRFGAIS
jgi:hypothetical protein